MGRGIGVEAGSPGTAASDGATTPGSGGASADVDVEAPGAGVSFTSAAPAVAGFASRFSGAVATTIGGWLRSSAVGRVHHHAAASANTPASAANHGTRLMRGARAGPPCAPRPRANCRHAWRAASGSKLRLRTGDTGAARCSRRGTSRVRGKPIGGRMVADFSAAGARRSRESAVVRATRAISRGAGCGSKGAAAHNGASRGRSGMAWIAAKAIAPLRFAAM